MGKPGDGTESLPNLIERTLRKALAYLKTYFIWHFLGTVRCPVNVPSVPELSRPPKSGRIIQGTGREATCTKSGILWLAEPIVYDSSEARSPSLFLVTRRRVDCRYMALRAPI